MLIYYAHHQYIYFSRRETFEMSMILELFPGAEIDNPAWLDHPDWVCSVGTTRSARDLFADARGRCPAGNVIMIYIRSMGGGSVGCGGPTLAGEGRPGFVNTDAASNNTFAHEIGHLLFGFAHSTDPTNLMFVPSGSIAVDPPQLTPGQCRLTLGAGAVHECGPIPPPPPVAGPRSSPVTPVGLSPVRAGLLAAEEGDFGVVLALGAADVLQELSTLVARDPVPALRARAAGALGLIGGDEAARALCRAARSDGHPVVRLMAAHQLGRLGGAEAAAALAGLVHDRDVGVRLTALRGLSASGTSSGDAAVARLADRDPSQHVRAAARSLLG
jgi:hypothetical protein